MTRIGCKHHGEQFTEHCRYCFLFATNKKYRKKWGGTGEVEVKSFKPKPSGAIRLVLCEWLGKRIAPAGCNCPRKDGYVCVLGLGIVRPNTECEVCPQYQPSPD